MHVLGRIARPLLALGALLVSACVTPPPLSESIPSIPSPQRPERARGHIVVCGERVGIDAPVVLWTEAPFYDAYSKTHHFRPRAGRIVAEAGPRLVEGRAARGALAALAPGSDELALLRAHVTQFVIHYDVCAASRRCFEVLQDMRGLSAHFLLDVDGTIYQTCDLRETCWHATKANSRSVGVEIANIGAYPVGAQAKTLDAWYERDAQGPYAVYPPWFGETGIRTPDFTARPRRPERIRGLVHGAEFEQHDFTREQYASLAALSTVLHEILEIPLRVPRDAAGRVRGDALSEPEFEAWSGLIGHQHITRRKTDPGPAFDWDHLLQLTGRIDP